MRQYYLTVIGYYPTQILTACADGYHFASLWEILNISKLQYNNSLGFNSTDSGSGPNTTSGWVRTGGGENYSSMTPGNAN